MSRPLAAVLIAYFLGLFAAVSVLAFVDPGAAMALGICGGLIGVIVMTVLVEP